jgi:hypothetical protein
MANCSSCGGALGGRFCGLCGADNGPAPDAPPTQPFPGSAPPPPRAGTTYAEPVPVEPVEMEAGFPDIGGVFRSAWKTSSQHVGDWVVTTIVAGVIVAVIIALYAVYNWITTDSEKFGNISIDVKHPIPFLELIIGVVAVLALSYIRYGFARTALATARGHRAIFNDAWSPARFLPFLVFDFVIGWLLVAGFIVPFVGTFVILATCLYSPFLILERKGSGVTAIWNSMSMTTSKGRFWRQSLFTLIGAIVLLSFAGAFWTILQILGQSGYGDWSSTWQALVAILLGLVEFVIIVIAVIIAMTAAATAYVNLEREG